MDSHSYLNLTDKQTILKSVAWGYGRILILETFFFCMIAENGKNKSNPITDIKYQKLKFL